MSPLLAGIHPTMALALAPHMESAVVVCRAQYVSALIRHDWSYAFSDDGAAYRRGREERARLLIEAAALDPEFALWNTHAPAEFKRGGL